MPSLAAVFAFPLSAALALLSLAIASLVCAAAFRILCGVGRCHPLVRAFERLAFPCSWGKSIAEGMLSRSQAVFAFPRFAIGCENCRKGDLHRLLIASKSDGFLELSTGLASVFLNVPCVLVFRARDPY